jgi:hypothetical protein
MWFESITANVPETADGTKKPMEHICLHIKQDQLDIFYQLLNRGFRMKTRVGCTLRELLCGELGLENDYLDHRIKTIFLNGKAVDNVDTAVVENNAVLALSAAMPGLVGATMRKDGFYAAMRNQISHTQPRGDENISDGWVTIKLFNMVAVELGALFLRAGIWIDGEGLMSLLSSHFERLNDALLSGTRNGQAVSMDRLGETDWLNHEILLRVE